MPPAMPLFPVAAMSATLFALASFIAYGLLENQALHFL